MEKWKIADDAGGGGGRFCAEGDLLNNQGPGIHDPGQARPEVADGRGEDRDVHITAESRAGAGKGRIHRVLANHRLLQ